MEDDVTKTSFSQKLLNGFFRNFGRRRQIEAGEGTESFASVSADVFDISRKVGRGGRFSPPSQARVNERPKSDKF